MKNQITIFLLLVAAIVSAQSTRVFTAKCNVAQSGSGSGYWQVAVTSLNDPGGLDATEIQTNDKLLFNDGGIQYTLNVTTVISAVGASATIRVSNVGVTGISSVPTTAAVISRATENYSFVPFPANISANDVQLLQEKTMYDIDSLLNVVANTGGGGLNWADTTTTPGLATQHDLSLIDFFQDTTYVAGSGQSNYDTPTPFGADTVGLVYYEVWDSTANVYKRGQRGTGIGQNFCIELAKSKKTLVRYFHSARSGRSITHWTNTVGDSTYTNLDNQLAAAGNPDLSYFLWCQGEQDAAQTDAWYLLKFDTLRMKLMSEPWWDSTGTKIIVGGLALGAGKTKALQNIGSGSLYYNVGYASSDSLKTLEGVHYIPTARQRFGKRYFDASQKMPFRQYGLPTAIPYYNANGVMKNDYRFTYDDNASSNTLWGYSTISSYNTYKFDIGNGKMDIGGANPRLSLQSGAVPHSYTLTSAPPNPRLFVNGYSIFKQIDAECLVVYGNSHKVFTVGSTGSAEARVNILRGETGAGDYLWVSSSVASVKTGDILKLNGNGVMSLGNATVENSALLSLTSTTRGLLPPVMTRTQINAIPTPATGLFAYQTTTNKPIWYNGSAWRVALDSTTAAATFFPLTGTITNNDASAGNVGEYVSSVIATGSSVPLTTATPANVTSISLTAGDWDVEGWVNYDYGTATVSQSRAGINTASATIPTDGSEVYSATQLTLTSSLGTISLTRKRISIASTTTVYLVGQATFSAGTTSAFGGITARRVR